MQEALFWAARQTGPQAQVGELLTGYGGRERWRHIRRASQVLAARLAPRPAGSFEGGLGWLKERLGDRFQHWQSWSPSGLEVYTNCPHRFFAERVLDLEARETPEVGFDAAQLGSMLHAILEKTYRSVEDPTDEEALLNALEETANREFEQAPDLYGFRANVTWEVEKAGLRALLRENVSALVSESEGWTPIGLELPFGIRGTPPLELNIDDRRLQIRGLIDRVDRDPAGRLRVIDYKTGGSHLSARDLETGRRLQLPLYALAAEQALGLGSAAEGFYWHLRGTRPGGLKLSRFKGALGEGPEGALATAKSHVATIVEDVNEGLFPPIPPDGGCPSYCAAAAWCWRYTPGYS